MKITKRDLGILFVGIILTVIVTQLIRLNNTNEKTKLDTNELQEEVLPVQDNDNEQVDEIEVSEPVEVIEVNLSCNKATEIMIEIKEVCGSMPFPGVDECIQMRIDRAEVELKDENLARAEKMKTLYEEYVKLNVGC